LQCDVYSLPEDVRRTERTCYCDNYSTQLRNQGSILWAPQTESLDHKWVKVMNGHRTAYFENLCTSTSAAADCATTKKFVTCDKPKRIKAREVTQHSPILVPQFEWDTVWSHTITITMSKPGVPTSRAVGVQAHWNALGLFRWRQRKVNVCWCSISRTEQTMKLIECILDPQTHEWNRTYTRIQADSEKAQRSEWLS